MPVLLLSLLFSIFSPPHAHARGRPDFLHPGFTLRTRDLAELTVGIPAPSAARIAKEPVPFLDEVLAVMNGRQDLLVLVDKGHALPKSFVPPDLVRLSGFSLPTSRSGMKLRSVLIDDLLQLSAACKAAGASLTISSAYRSYATQEALFAADLEKKPKEEVEQDLAVPGHSQHQLGTAIDLGSIDTSFDDTPSGRWMRENAWRYGFSLSYPKGGQRITGYTWEPWHFRYVGRAAAALIRDYFADSQQIFLAWYDLKRGFLEERRIR
jgi:D-alanyl-D-alanine carboxypeptidase